MDMAALPVIKALERLLGWIILQIPPMIFLGIQECKVLLYILWEVIAKIATE